MPEKDGKKDGASADEPRGIRVDPEASASFVDVSKIFSDEHPAVKIRALTDQQVKAVKEIVVARQEGGASDPISEEAFIRFLDGLESDQTSDLEPPIIDLAEITVVGDTMVFSTRWLEEYAKDCEAAPPEKEPEVFEGENLIILNSKGPEALPRYTEEDNVRRAAGMLFTFPIEINFRKGVVECEMPYLDENPPSMVAISKTDLAEAERIARIIRKKSPEVAVVFLYTDEDAAKYGDGWKDKIAQLQEWNVFDGFINTNSRAENIAGEFYLSRKRQMNISGYGRALRPEDKNKIKTKIETFYEIFNKHLKSWEAIVAKLQLLLEDDRSIKIGFLESVKIFYKYFDELYKFREKISTSPYEAVFILNILQQQMQTLVLCPEFLNKSSLDIKSINKLGEAVHKLLVFFHGMDKKAKRNLRINVTNPPAPAISAPPKLEPVLLSAEDLIEINPHAEGLPKVATPERIGPPEKAILVLTTVDIPETVADQGSGLPFRMIDVEAVDVAELKLDLKTSAEKRRFGAPARQQGKKLIEEMPAPPVKPTDKNDRAFLDYVIQNIDPSAARIDKPLTEALRAVDFKKTRVVLVIVDVRHSLENQGDILTLLKKEIGATTPILLTVQNGLALDLNVRKQIKELEREGVASSIPDFSINNFISLIITLRRVMRQNIDAVDITLPEGQTEDPNWRDALSSLCDNKYAKDVPAWSSLLNTLTASDGGITRTPLLPPSRNVRDLIKSACLAGPSFTKLKFRSGTKNLQGFLVDLKRFENQLSDLACLLLIYQKIEMEKTFFFPREFDDSIGSYSKMLEGVSALRSEVAQLILRLTGKEGGSISSRLEIIHEE